jgi:uncharacterized protein (DUF1501 family)
VVIYLGAGNDGLNTVAPFGEGAYYDARPKLAIKENEALPLAGKLGLNPNLKGLKKLWDASKLAVIQGVGYPNPDRSHFRSFDIWATAQDKGVSPVGWLGRYLDLTDRTGQDPLRAITVGTGVAKPQDLTVVRSRGQTAISAAHAVQNLGSAYAPAATYPKQNKLAPNLQLIVKLLAGGAETQLFFTTLGGFDDHANEKAGHDSLLKQFDEAVTAYQQDLEAHGLGAAAPAFLLGATVKGGLIGDHPSMTVVVDGDLKMGIDFRSLYASLIETWLGGPTAQEVLGARYELLPLLRG